MVKEVEMKALWTTLEAGDEDDEGESSAGASRMSSLFGSLWAPRLPSAREETAAAVQLRLSHTLGKRGGVTFNNPTHVALQPGGDILCVTDSDNNRVQTFSLKSGVARDMITSKNTTRNSGNWGEEGGEGALTLAGPRGIACGGDSIYVVELSMERVQKVR